MLIDGNKDNLEF